MRHRTFIWFGLIAAIVLGVLWDFYPLANSEDRLRLVRANGSNFSSQDLPLTRTEQSVFANAKVIHRRYQFEGHRVFVTLVDGTENRHAVHDPGYCFQGAGWKVVDQTTITVPGGRAKRFKAVRKTETMVVMYWFSDGCKRHASFPRYWWQTTLRRITLGRSGPEPVLVVLQAPNEKADWPILIPKMIDALSL
ncbi:MAG: exosortase-associated EpsI family protein [Verrucomicrobia bacterium]|nr:exosortase-associated EpsI family protein [Verrucomicrobiota bacterium]